MSVAQLVKQSRVTSFSKEIAKEHGVNESIFLGQLDYWLQAKGRVIDGEVWYYSTYENWTNEYNLPFWSISTVKRTVKSLVSKGLIKTTDKYNKMPMDKTLWYTIVGWSDHEVNLTLSAGQPDTMDDVNLTPAITIRDNHNSTHDNINLSQSSVRHRQLPDTTETPATPDGLIRSCLEQDIPFGITVAIMDQHRAIVDQYGIEAWHEAWKKTKRSVRSNPRYLVKVVISSLSGAAAEPEQEEVKEVWYGPGVTDNSEAWGWAKVDGDTLHFRFKEGGEWTTTHVPWVQAAKDGKLTGNHLGMFHTRMRDEQVKAKVGGNGAYSY